MNNMNITKETFEQLSSKTFQITFNENTVAQSELIEIKANPKIQLQDGQIEPFSLVFEVADSEVFDQNTYLLKSDELEEMPIFLVPIGQDEKGVRYEAIFN